MDGGWDSGFARFGCYANQSILLSQLLLADRDQGKWSKIRITRKRFDGRGELYAYDSVAWPWRIPQRRVTRPLPLNSAPLPMALRYRDTLRFLLRGNVAEVREDHLPEAPLA